MRKSKIKKSLPAGRQEKSKLSRRKVGIPIKASGQFKIQNFKFCIVILTPLEILFRYCKFVFLTGLIFAFCILNLTGCVPLLVGGAAGALGAYAVGKDTVQGDTDKPYDNLWNAALTISRIRGAIKQEDRQRGYIELEADSSKVSIRLIKLTRATTRLKVTSRKHHLPNLDLAQDIFVKIMEQTR